MVNMEEILTNFKDAVTRVTVVDIRTLTGTKRGKYKSWQRRDRKLHSVKLTNISAILGPQKNIFSMK